MSDRSRVWPLHPVQQLLMPRLNRRLHPVQLRLLSCIYKRLHPGQPRVLSRFHQRLRPVQPRLLPRIHQRFSRPVQLRLLPRLHQRFRPVQLLRRAESVPSAVGRRSASVLRHAVPVAERRVNRSSTDVPGKERFLKSELRCFAVDIWLGLSVVLSQLSRREVDH